MEQTGTVAPVPAGGVPAAVARRVVELLHPEELVGLARRAMDAGDGPTALALQEAAEVRMGWLLGPGGLMGRRDC